MKKDISENMVGKCCCGSPVNTGGSCCPVIPAPAIPDKQGLQEEKQVFSGEIDRFAPENIPVVDARLSFSDRVGAWKVRWGIGRMNYRTEPGLYAIGSPDNHSPVLVTANYKLSFDTLRSQLQGISAWILVLDTNGVNVWCAAGKGTFGTGELAARIDAVRLRETVSHRTLILPQLGAPGVSAHEVKRLSGFRVVYGPVRAHDVPTFLDDGMKATKEMRRVRFTLRDRAVLIPIELVQSVKYAAGTALVFFLLAGLGRGGFSVERAVSDGVHAAIVIFSAVAAGTVITPLLLPWLPGRAFSLKGFWGGLVCAALLSSGFSRHNQGSLTAASWFLLVPAISSFLAMNFTGATTFTSLSGVKKEVSSALPLQVAAAALGVVVWIIGRFF